jgi:hypothetical protein
MPVVDKKRIIGKNGGLRRRRDTRGLLAQKKTFNSIQMELPSPTPA